MKKMMNKAEYGATVKDPKKSVSKKTVSKKPMVSPKKKPTVSPKKKTYDIIPDEVTNEGYLNLGPREETPGGGFSRNGSMMKKIKSVTSMMKMGGKMAKQAAVAIAMKKAGKAPKKKMQYGGEAASMAPTMKKGGSMKKCKYGCK
jgi:hypothetical protein